MYSHVSSYPFTNLRKTHSYFQPPTHIHQISNKMVPVAPGGWSELWMLWSPALKVLPAPHPVINLLIDYTQRPHFLVSRCLVRLVSCLHSFHPPMGHRSPCLKTEELNVWDSWGDTTATWIWGRKVAGVGEHHEGLEGPWELAPHLLQGVHYCLLLPCCALCSPTFNLCLSLTLVCLQCSTLR